MSIAINPGQWYYALLNYKKLQWEEFCRQTAALPYVWLESHWPRLTKMVGGEPHFITIVPSKKLPYEKQKLRQLLLPLGDLVVQTLDCVDPSLYERYLYAPDMFRPVANSNLRGKRVILIEDTWITGATALSAAGALFREGVESVVITPIAREFKPSHFGDHPESDHPYAGLIAGEYDVTAWPR